MGVFIRCLHYEEPIHNYDGSYISSGVVRRARVCVRRSTVCHPAPATSGIDGRMSHGIQSMSTVLHFDVFLRRRTFNLYAYISSECDVNFVHCRIVYSLESHLVYKI